MFDRKEIITTKTINMIDVSKFHVGCAYFIQSDMHGGSYITGILYSANEDNLTFTTNNGDYNITVSDIMDPDRNFRFTLLLPEKYNHAFPDIYFNQ